MTLGQLFSNVKESPTFSALDALLGSVLRDGTSPQADGCPGLPQRLCKGLGGTVHCGQPIHESAAVDATDPSAHYDDGFSGAVASVTS